MPFPLAAAGIAKGIWANRKAIAVGLLLVAIVTTVFVTKRYIAQLHAENATLTANVAVVETALGTQKGATDHAVKVIEQWKQAYDKQQEKLDEYEAIVENADQERKRLDKVFADSDIEALANAKPTLIELTVNRGTARVIGLLECATTSGGCGTAKRGDAL